jgi:hypothetical protein
MRSRLAFGVALAIGASFAAACSSSKPPVDGSGFGDDGGAGGGTGGGLTGAGSGSGGGSGGALGGSGSGSGAGNASGCSDAAKLVYVLSQENDLYSFDPPNKKFTKIGALGCNTTMTPNSMAVSRDAVAWVNYIQQDATGNISGGAMFKVSTADASCQPTNITLPKAWYHLGMGYSTDGATATTETLFVAATGTGVGLGKLDTTAGTVTSLGSFTGSLSNMDAELTGTGDGRLFGFFTQDPGGGILPPTGTPQVAQIDKTSAATSNVVPMTGVTAPLDWAFSFWGGDFYLYTWTSDPNGSAVTHYSPATGAIDTAYMTGIGFHIVGAGVSTCAPTTPPK